jgi:oligopeptidase B
MYMCVCVFDTLSSIDNYSQALPRDAVDSPFAFEFGVRVDDLWRYVAQECNIFHIDYLFPFIYLFICDKAEFTSSQFRNGSHLSALSNQFEFELRQFSASHSVDSVVAELVADDAVAVAADNGTLFFEERCGFFSCYFMRVDMSPRRLVLNVSELAALNRGEYLAVAQVAVSADARWLAYLVDRVGDERYELRVRSLDTLLDSPPLAVCHENLHWLASRSAVACTVLDDVYSQPLLIRLVDIGDGAFGNVSARIIFNQTSPEFALELSAADSGAVLIAASQGQVTSDIRYLVLSDNDTELRTLLPARRGVQMWPLHVALGESASAPAFAWIARTNMGDAPNYRIVAAKSHLSADADDAAPGDWLELIAHDDAAMLMDMQWLPRSGSLVVLRLRDVDVEVCVTQIDARFDDPQRPWMIATGALACVTPRVGRGAAQRLELEQSVDTLHTTRTRPLLSQPYAGCVDSFVVRAQSLVDPPATFAVHVCANGTLLVEETARERYAAHSSGEYETERFEVGANAVPLTVARHSSTADLGGGPVLLTGYGAYASTLFPTFTPHYVVLMQRRWTVALCHVRGSAARGMRWYHDGKGERKQHSFDDLRLCAEWLVERGVARSARHIALFGRSAGGLLAASTALQWADRFGVVLLQAPFVDVLATMTDALAPWTVFEWQEWGDPLTDANIAAQMYNYSPYSLAQRMRDAPACFALPIMLQTGLRDAIVRYYEHARLAAQMRASMCAQERFLLQVTDSGHVGGTGDRAVRDLSEQMAFVVAHVEREPPSADMLLGVLLSGVLVSAVTTVVFTVLRCRRQRPNAVKV